MTVLPHQFPENDDQKLPKSLEAKDSENSLYSDLLTVKVDEQKHKLFSSSSTTSISLDQNGIDDGKTVTSSSSTISKDIIDPWPSNHYAKNYVCGLITVFYALLVIIYGMMLSLWEWQIEPTDNYLRQRFHHDHTNYTYFLCVVAYIFFVYCYIVRFLRQKWGSRILKFIRSKILFRNKNDTDENMTIDDGTIMPVVGCLYLRFGAVVFAIITAVFYAYAATLKSGYFQVNILKTIFIILQTHFIYCSSELFDSRHYIICRFGTMHCVAVNIVTAFEFIFSKGQSNQQSVEKAFKINKTSSVYVLSAPATVLSTTLSSIADDSSESIEIGADSIINRVVRSSVGVMTDKNGNFMYVLENCSDAVECALGSFTKVFYTAIVEYSLIAAAGICMTKKWSEFSRVLVASHTSRIIQAVIQCFLICIASKAKVNGRNKREQPGKQTITFLIIVNIAIFIMNLFESDKVGTSEVVVDFYGKENWVFLVRTFSPLTVFYRFHSSVCLAEIWKNTYSFKQH